MTPFVNVLWLSYTPLDVPGLMGWFDAADESTITHSSGSVSQWNDKSGNAWHASQPTAAAQPTTGLVTLNGLNVIDFDGVDDFLATAANSPELTALTFAVVARHDTFGGSGYGRVLEIDTERRLNVSTVTGTPATENNFEFALASATPLRRFSADNTAPTAAWSIVVATHSGGTDVTSLDIRKNGANVNDFAETGTLGASLNKALVLGNRLDGLRGHDGGIAEIVVSSVALTGADLASLEQHLASKWGLTLS